MTGEFSWNEIMDEMCQNLKQESPLVFEPWISFKKSEGKEPVLSVFVYRNLYWFLGILSLASYVEVL